MHLEFCVLLYRGQLKNGRYLLHEHPAHASSWQTDVMEKFMREPGVMRVTCDQCIYGCEAEDNSPVKKPTSFSTNAPELGRELSTRGRGRVGLCSRPEGGVHTQCRGKTARLAAMYHLKLCRAILVGFRRQLKFDGVCKDGFVGMLDAKMEKTDVLSVFHLGTVDQIFGIEVDGETVYRDDLTGQVLPPRPVREARQKELDFFESKGVWTKRAIDEARRRTGKLPITVRWVDV